MFQQMPIFPLHDAYNQVKDYWNDEWLSIRVIMSDHDMIIIHIHPSDDMPDDVDMETYLCEQTDTYADDYSGWFPYLNVRYGCRDNDWYIITITQ